MNKKILFFILSPLLLMIPAFYNGYPLVYSDTGTYIMSGMELILPRDRPITYGLFIRIFSFGFSLWPVIYVQSFITTYCLWQVTKLSSIKIKPGPFLILLFILSCFTGLGWYSSQIMPDIFTVNAILSLLLLLNPKKVSKVKLIAGALIFVLSVNVHFSNFPIVVFLMLGILIFWRVTSIFKGVKYITALLLFSLTLASGTNFIIDKTFKINKGSHVFLVGKMLDSGVLKSFLDNNCAQEDYAFCECKDSLPADSRALLWAPNGPLAKHGGWTGSEKAYNKLLVGIFTSPKHLALFCYNSFFSSASQLFQNDVGSGLVSAWYRDPSSPPYHEISKHFKFELNTYSQSRQNGNLWNQELDLTFVNAAYSVLLSLSFVFLLAIFALKKFKKIVNHETQFLVVGLFIGIVSNAIVTASLANVYDRLQARTSWMIILCAVLIALSSKAHFIHKTKLFFTKSKMN